MKREYADLLREADAIFIEELRKADLYDKVSQAFVVFLPVKSVGVMGDGRTYEWVVSLRSVETSDFMTAKWASSLTTFSVACPTGSLMKSAASTGWFMTSPASRLPLLSGSDPGRGSCLN